MNNKRVLFPRKQTPSGRQTFTAEEDTYLKFLVFKYGDFDWNLIASMMGNRTARQCRERYKNYLAPNLNSSKWTSEEDNLLLQKYAEFGSKWTMISQYFNNRTVVNVKNRCNYLISRFANPTHQHVGFTNIENSSGASESADSSEHLDVCLTTAKSAQTFQPIQPIQTISTARSFPATSRFLSLVLNNSLQKV